jgi:uncharacterized membrane protein YczE
MILSIPLMLIPLVLYNALVFGIYEQPVGEIWSSGLFSLDMVSNATWTMTMGDLMITIGLIVLFVEILKSTRASTLSILDHVLSTAVFIGFLVEFVVVQKVAHSVFFILMMVSLIDVVAGFSVTIRSAMRDVSIDRMGL